MASRRWRGRVFFGSLAALGLALSLAAGCSDSSEEEPGEEEPEPEPSQEVEPLFPAGFNAVEDLDRGVVAVFRRGLRGLANVGTRVSPR